MGKSAGGLGEERGEKIRTVNEFRVVAVPGDTVIVGSPLLLVGGALGDIGCTTREGEGGEIGRHHRHIA